jgi:hypothetical protein
MLIVLTTPDLTKKRVNSMSISSYFTYSVFNKEKELVNQTRVSMNNGESIEVIESSEKIDSLLNDYFRLT